MLAEPICTEQAGQGTQLTAVLGHRDLLPLRAPFCAGLWRASPWPTSYCDPFPWKRKGPPIRRALCSDHRRPSSTQRGCL